MSTLRRGVQLLLSLHLAGVEGTRNVNQGEAIINHEADVNLSGEHEAKSKSKSWGAVVAERAEPGNDEFVDNDELIDDELDNDEPVDEEPDTTTKAPAPRKKKAMSIRPPSPKEFHGAVVHGGMNSSVTAQCGSEILIEVSLTQDKVLLMHRVARSLLVERMVRSEGKNHLVATGNNWDVLLGQLTGISEGMKLVRVENEYVPDNTQIRTLMNKMLPELTPENPTIEFAFIAGYDFRGCWGNLKDYDDRGVCGKEVMEAFAKELIQAHKNPTKNGDIKSEIFEIKQVEEIELFLDFLESLHKEEMMERQRAKRSCYSTSLAPTCFTVRDSIGRHWAVIRKVELGKDFGPGSMKMPKGDTFFKDAFLQGPHVLRKQLLWPTRNIDLQTDRGFATAFKKGIQLDHCGSRDAAYTYLRDTQMLEKKWIKDYKMHVRLQTPADGVALGCRCKAGDSLFPILLRVDTTDDPTAEPIWFATAITDYMTMIKDRQRVGGVKKKAPQEQAADYAFNFQRMWPAYFKAHHAVLVDDAWISIPGIDEMLDERIELGDKICALEEMQWTKSGKELVPADAGPEPKKFYPTQVEPWTPTTASSSWGFKKVSRGQEGQIVEFLDDDDGSYIRVQWLDDEDMLFKVRPHQIVSALERKFRGDDYDDDKGHATARMEINNWRTGNDKGLAASSRLHAALMGLLLLSWVM